MVFISYSHDSDDLCDKVLELSNYLRDNGIDSNIDQYEECPPEGWPRWMENQIRTAEFVIVVCTALYLKKATLQVNDTVGLVTKWETNIIENFLYDTGAVTNKYIPVVFDDEDVKSILTPLKGHTYYNLKYTQKKEDLKNRLLGIKKNKKPPLGTSKCAPKIAKLDARLLITGVIDTDTWDKAKWKGVGYAFDFSTPPLLGLMYENNEVGIKIFSDWINRFRDNDEEDEIYISIIEDYDSDSYSVHIGADIEGVIKRLKKNGIDYYDTYFIQLDRWHRMQIVDKKYLECFKLEFLKHKCFYLVPMIPSKNGITPLIKLAIKKKKIMFRKFSELKDEKDYDYLALKLRKVQDA